jgi:hypothetical protein
VHLSRPVFVFHFLPPPPSITRGQSGRFSNIPAAARRDRSWTHVIHFALCRTHIAVLTPHPERYGDAADVPPVSGDHSAFIGRNNPNRPIAAFPVNLIAYRQSMQRDGVFLFGPYPTLDVAHPGTSPFYDYGDHLALSVGATKGSFYDAPTRPATAGHWTATLSAVRVNPDMSWSSPIRTYTYGFQISPSGALTMDPFRRVQ